MDGVNWGTTGRTASKVNCRFYGKWTKPREDKTPEDKIPENFANWDKTPELIFRGVDKTPDIFFNF